MAPRKHKVREYCHACGEYSEWIYEDRDGNQIIECPKCGHLHYRMVAGKVVDFEIEFRGEKIRNMNRVREILAEHPETKAELERMWAVLEYGDLEMALALRVTGKRWGQDPRQHAQATQWALSTTTVNYLTTYWSYSVSSSSNAITYWSS